MPVIWDFHTGSSLLWGEDDRLWVEIPGRVCLPHHGALGREHVVASVCLLCQWGSNSVLWCRCKALWKRPEIKSPRGKRGGKDSEGDPSIFLMKRPPCVSIMCALQKIVIRGMRWTVVFRKQPYCWWGTFLFCCAVNITNEKPFGEPGYETLAFLEMFVSISLPSLIFYYNGLSEASARDSVRYPGPFFLIKL